MCVITVIGCGMMGSSIVIPASENGHTVRLVGSPLDDRIVRSVRETHFHPTLKRQMPPSIRAFFCEEMAEALEGADLVISGVSSFGVEWFKDSILPVLPDGLPILSITKGMIAEEDGSLISYPEYYQRSFPDRKLDISAVGGPCTSYELADRDPTQVTFCGTSEKTLTWLRDIFTRPYYHVALSTNVRSVELAVALKNAYALGTTLAVGMAEVRDEAAGDAAQEKDNDPSRPPKGAGIHYNSQAALFGQSVREMQRLLALHGCSADALYVGAGDLFVTIFGGRTRLIGRLLGRGMSYEEALASLAGVTLESTVISERTAASLSRLAARGKADPKDFPLLSHISRVMKGEAEGPDVPWEAFA